MRWYAPLEGLTGLTEKTKVHTYKKVKTTETMTLKAMEVRDTGSKRNNRFRRGAWLLLIIQQRTTQNRS